MRCFARRTAARLAVGAENEGIRSVFSVEGGWRNVLGRLTADLDDLRLPTHTVARLPVSVRYEGIHLK